MMIALLLLPLLVGPTSCVGAPAPLMANDGLTEEHWGALDPPQKLRLATIQSSHGGVVVDPSAGPASNPAQEAHAEVREAVEPTPVSDSKHLAGKITVNPSVSGSNVDVAAQLKDQHIATPIADSNKKLPAPPPNLKQSDQASNDEAPAAHADEPAVEADETPTGGQDGKQAPPPDTFPNPEPTHKPQGPGEGGSGVPSEQAALTADDTVIPTVEISKVYYINLSEEAARREHVQSELNRFNLNSELVEGVYPQDMSSQSDYHELCTGCAAGDWSPSKDPTAMRLCASDLAHRRAFAKIAQQNDNSLYLLVEDDVVFDDHWLERLPEQMQSAPSDWDILRLGWWGESDIAADRVSDSSWVHPERQSRPRDSSNCSPDCVDGREFYYYGAHAMLTTPAKARQLVDRLSSTQLTAADAHTGRNSQHHDLTVYALMDPTINTKSSMPNYKRTTTTNDDISSDSDGHSISHEAVGLSETKTEAVEETDKDQTAQGENEHQTEKAVEDNDKDQMTQSEEHSAQPEEQSEERKESASEAELAAAEAPKEVASEPEAAEAKAEDAGEPEADATAEGASEPAAEAGEAAPEVASVSTSGNPSVARGNWGWVRRTKGSWFDG